MSTVTDDDNYQRSTFQRATSGDIDSHPSSQRFRFKSRSSKRHTQDDVRHSTRSFHDHRKHHHGGHHRPRKRRRLSPAPGPQSPSPTDVGTSSMHPDVAFRESLFDAMGDDEGAAYWESVYGQPIHTYPDVKRNEETGELEKLTDEQYIAFVRKGMWERSWEGIEAQREQRRKDRIMEEREQEQAKRKKTDASGDDERTKLFEREVEESLRRGVERRERKRWREKWEAYEKAWDDLYQLARPTTSAASGADDTSVHLRNEIIWPVESGKRKDVGSQEVERFLVKTVGSLEATNGLDSEAPRFLSHLKLERVRWHPDKVQQRFGSLNIDEGTLKGVTEVFQVMDRLYNEKK